MTISMGACAREQTARESVSSNGINGALLPPSNNGKLKSLHRLFKGGSSRRRNLPSLIAPTGRLKHCDYCSKGILGFDAQLFRLPLPLLRQALLHDSG